MEEFVSLFVNNGTAIAVIIYFMWRDYKFMGNLQATLTQLVETTSCLKNVLNKEEVK